MRAGLDCSAPHLYCVSSSEPMSCSHVASVVNDVCWSVMLGLWRGVGQESAPLLRYAMEHGCHLAGNKQVTPGYNQVMPWFWLPPEWGSAV